MRTTFRCLAIALMAWSCDANEPGGVTLDIAADPMSVQPTQLVSITLRAVNHSARTVTAWAPGFYGFCNHAFQAFDASGREVAVPTGFCAAMLVLPALVELAPGESVTITDSWDPSSSTVAGQPLAPGTYRIVGHYVADDREIASPGLTITLQP